MTHCALSTIIVAFLLVCFPACIYLYTHLPMYWWIKIDANRALCARLAECRMTEAERRTLDRWFRLIYVVRACSIYGVYYFCTQPHGTDRSLLTSSFASRPPQSTALHNPGLLQSPSPLHIRAAHDCCSSLQHGDAGETALPSGGWTLLRTLRGIFSWSINRCFIVRSCALKLTRELANLVCRTQE